MKICYMLPHATTRYRGDSVKKNILEFSDLVALTKKLPNSYFVPLFTSNCYMNSNRDLRVYRVGTNLLMTNPLENNIL